MEGGSSQLPAAIRQLSGKGEKSFEFLQEFRLGSECHPWNPTAALRGEPDAPSWLTMAPSEFFFETGSARVG